MRIVFMGTPEFAVPTLLALHEAGHEIPAVYTQPPRPAGRGKAERKSPVQLAAEKLGIEACHPLSLRDLDAQADFLALEPELAVVVAYGLILPKAILDGPKRGCLNVHASLLPRWRGAAPIQRAILAGDHMTGVTIMRMEEGLDTGPMLLKRRTPIDSKTAGELTEELARLGADALLEWIAEPTPPVPQAEDAAAYAPKIAKSEARIDWSRSADEIERQARAFAPSPGAWFDVNGERIKVLQAAAGDDAAGKPGEVLDDCLCIACGSGYLRPLRVQRAGRDAMTAGELLRGFKISKGTILA